MRPIGLLTNLRQKELSSKLVLVERERIVQGDAFLPDDSARALRDAYAQWAVGSKARHLSRQLRSLTFGGSSTAFLLLWLGLRRSGARFFLALTAALTAGGIGVWSRKRQLAYARSAREAAERARELRGEAIRLLREKYAALGQLQPRPVYREDEEETYRVIGEIGPEVELPLIIKGIVRDSGGQIEREEALSIAEVLLRPGRPFCVGRRGRHLYHIKVGNPALLPPSRARSPDDPLVAGVVPNITGSLRLTVFLGEEKEAPQTIVYPRPEKENSSVLKQLLDWWDGR